MAVVLASQSPRRRELMALVLPGYEADTAGVDEAALAGLPPAQLAQALATQKAQAVFARRSGDVVIGCDTVVEIDGTVLGKPADEKEAADMLRALSGRRHLVHTGVCVCTVQAPPACFTETTAVDFAEIPEAEIAAYVKTPEPYDKAGGYGIQGWAARFITGVQGCFYNVMGLPVAALYRTLRGLGIKAPGPRDG